MIASTVTDILVTDHTPTAMDITLCPQLDYSDEQFHADLRKASRRLDGMVEEALEEDAAGKTGRFP